MGILEAAGKVIESPVTALVICLVLGAAALSGKLSVNLAHGLLAAAVVAGIVGILRAGIGDWRLTLASMCGLVVSGCLLSYWMQPPKASPPKPSVPAPSTGTEPPAPQPSNASPSNHLPRTATPPELLFSQGVGQGVGGLVIFNGTDDPIDNVSISVMRSHAGPQYDADPKLLQQDLTSKFELDIGTLRPQLATPIKAVPASIFPYKDRPSFYQISIFTRYEAFTEWLYVTPKGNGSGMFDQTIDLSSNKTHRWFRRDTEAAMKRWKNWPEWWK